MFMKKFYQYTENVFKLSPTLIYLRTLQAENRESNLRLVVYEDFIVHTCLKLASIFLNNIKAKCI